MSSSLVLTGPPGVGKSTVGALCAVRLGWRLVDTDEELARRHGLPVPTIFARYGEAHFRAHEAALISELAAESHVVIATGGGAILNESSRAVLLGLGVVVCLAATKEELARRLGPEVASTRPLLQQRAGTSLTERLGELLHERHDAYRSLPYHLDTTTATPESIAELACGLAAAEKERLVVTHPCGRYELVLGTGLLDYLGYALTGRGYSGPIAIVSDTNVGPLYAERVKASLQAAQFSCFVHLLPAGEIHKNLATVESLCQVLSEREVERGGALLALGGGVVGDTAGLAAATYLRGIGLIHVPTSLLAMTDSSIGGKVGVNTAAGKNMVGAFKHPDLVVIDLGCLRTLPRAEFVSGLGEVVKAAIISGGAAYRRVQALSEQFHVSAVFAGAGEASIDPATRPVPAALPGLVASLHDALRLKRSLVEEDPEEQGRRILLNLGHTFAHGLEAWSEYRLRHGEAVSLGLLCAARVSASLGLCAASFPDELANLLHRLELPTTLTRGLDLQAPSAARAVEQIRAFMHRDKKRHARRNRFVLLRAPGDVFTCDFAEDEMVRDAVGRLF